jgi:hypothetical protein
MNTKIWFLLLAAGALSCAGCADQSITRQLQGVELHAQHMVEKKSGKPRKDWGPAETSEYNHLFLQALPQVRPRDYVSMNPITGQLEAPGLNDAARSQPVTAYGNGIQNVSPVVQ